MRLLARLHGTKSTMRPGPGRAPWTTLVITCVAQFMVVLDITVVNVALPSIGRDLRFATTDLQWVVAVYVLMTGGLLLLGGRLADFLGRKQIFIVGLGLFTAASLASGFAPSPAMLLAARALQGLGAAMLSPAALSIITTTYAGEQRTKALSTWGVLAAAGAATGVLLGGVLTTWMSWRWVFFINVPVGTAAIAACAHKIDGRHTRALRGLDLIGSLSLVGGLATAVFGIEGTSAHGWRDTRTVASFITALTLLSLFAVNERRVHQPLLSPATWRIRSLVSSAAVMLGASGVLVGTFFINSLLLQQGFGYSALSTGLSFLPLVGVTGVSAHVGPRLMVKLGGKAVAIMGLLIGAVGELLLTRFGHDASYLVDILPGFLLVGLGIGLSFVAVSVTAMADVDEPNAGLASGLMTTTHELGGAFGVAVFSTIALGSVRSTSTLITGVQHGALGGAATAIVLALLAAVAVPSYRPASMTRISMH